jgi:hypothetical protein
MAHSRPCVSAMGKPLLGYGRAILFCSATRWEIRRERVIIIVVRIENDLVPPEGGGGSPQTNPQALSAGTTNNTKKTEKKADNNSTLISGWWGERSSEKSLEITHSDPQSLSLYVENKVISELPYSESDKSIVSDATSFQVNDFYFPKDLC